MKTREEQIKKWEAFCERFDSYEKDLPARELFALKLWRAYYAVLRPFLRAWEWLKEYPRHGFLWIEVYNLCDYASEWILPRLRALQACRAGTPSHHIRKHNHYEDFEDSYCTDEEWDSYLADMIYALEFSTTEGWDEPDDRVFRGRYYLFVYWDSLWD